MMKKYLSFILAFVLLLAATVLPETAALANGNGTVLKTENPFYAHREIADGALQETEVQESEAIKYDGNTYYTRGRQLYATLARGMQARQKPIYLYYLSASKQRNFSKLTDEFFTAATNDIYAVSSTDGDYLRWSVANWTVEYRLDCIYGDYYCYTLVFYYTYLDTAEQEQQADAAVNRFVTSLDTGSMSDVQILKAVHDELCERNVYCYAALGDRENHYTAYTAYGALVEGTCVCQGYSLAFYRICRELGYSVRIITSDTHAWNLVGLDGKYYYVDVTWDDTYRDEGDVNNSYRFFLVSDDTLCSNDTDYEHMPEAKRYDNEYYKTNYESKIDANDYDFLNTSLLSGCRVSLSSDSFTYSGSAKCPAVTVTDRMGNPVSAQSYTVTYADNTNCGVARAALSGNGDFEGSSTHRLFYIAPAKAENLSLKSDGRDATALTLQWKAAGGTVSGYVLERYADGKWKTVKTLGASATGAKITSLSPATEHSFRMRAYKTVYKRRLYGAYSGIYKVCTKPKTPAAPTLKTAKKAVTVRWKKQNASGYEVQCSTAKNFKKGLKKQTAGAGATSKKFAKLKKGKTYYVRIRAYKSYNGKKYYSAWSKTKSVKCK